MKLVCLVIVCGIVLFTGPLPFHPASEPASAEKSKQELLDVENHWLQVEDDPAALESAMRLRQARCRGVISSRRPIMTRSMSAATEVFRGRTWSVHARGTRKKSLMPWLRK